MLTKKEAEVIEIFRQDILSEYTIRNLMKKLGKASYPWVHKTIQKLAKLSLINIKTSGKNKICSANLNNLTLLKYLSILEEEYAASMNLPINNIYELLNLIPLAYYSFLVTGSYAAGKAAKKSDLDIVVLVEDGVGTKSILIRLVNKGELMMPSVHPYVFTRSEFLEMLLSEEENYGKLIFRKRLILFGAENYYLIIKEAIKHGFRG